MTNLPGSLNHHSICAAIRSDWSLIHNFIIKGRRARDGTQFNGKQSPPSATKRLLIQLLEMIGD